ncbi:MAG TPA: trehalose utilization [Verrucomicrobiales bacterium]|nr:trehalose utilization [Verrucomicrobiales bacterium]
MKRLLISLILYCAIASVTAAEPVKVLIVDGQNNHKWAVITPLLKKHLEAAGVFKVEVATSPAKGGEMETFRPKFSDFDVVVSNYNGDLWSEEARRAFESFVAGGGGFVSVHAANNSFREWKEYNRMIGLGGWGDRNEQDGPYVRYWEGRIIRDASPGRGGSHGRQHEFALDVRDPEHPIMKGLPPRWMHAQDELYDRLRGPAENLNILATAFSDKSTNGSGHHEPLLMTLTYGGGRIFHTALGHDVPAVNCVGFITTFQRGTEWAATGKVTIPVPADFPTAEKSSSRN